MFEFLIKKGLSVSVVVGTLLIPLAAVAAVWLSTPEGEVLDATTSTPPTTSSTTITTPESDIAVDLASACGAEGLELVSLEESATITDVQQAALDALRDVCQQHGLPLPGQAAAAALPSVTTPPAARAGAAVVATAPPSTVQARDDDDEIEVEYEWDDDEYEYEYEHEVDD